MTDTEPLTVHQAIIEVARQVGSIAKERNAAPDMGGFKFRGIDDALNALHPVLCSVGLVILPRMVHRDVEKDRRRLVTIDVAFDFIGPDGSTATAGPFAGEGADGADKAANKAHSNAWKMMAFEVFTIPINDASIDAEAYNPRQDDPPTLAELWQQAPESKQAQADRCQERLDGVPAEWAERALSRMRERVNDPKFNNIRDAGPGWVDQLVKILDRLDEAIAKEEAAVAEARS